MEITPVGLIDGGARTGLLRGENIGTVEDAGTVRDLRLLSGDQITQVDFCEHQPAEISGYVYHDRDNDGTRDVGEEGIGRTTVILLDEQGQEVTRDVTDEAGHYDFGQLRAGRYSIVELHPDGWIDGKDSAGTIAGLVVGKAVADGDRINEIRLRWGDAGVDYNFGEYLGASIRGQVHLSTTDGDCFGADVDHPPLAGVRVELYHETGTLIDVTMTDDNGRYHFSGLVPGAYKVVEITPAGLIDGGARAGVLRGKNIGTVESAGAVRDLRLLSGDAILQVDFCEHEPSELAGVVYHDRNGDGAQDDGEEGIPRVVVKLVDENGRVINEDTTDPFGNYSFTALRAGNYTLMEIHPTGWLDGLDSRGTVDGQPTGVAINPGDMIQSIELGWGQTGVDFSFGEQLPGSISGRVHSDVRLDCVFNPDDGELLLAGVIMELVDQTGHVLGTTVTDLNGEYRFDDLAPGTYTVRELQPSNLFDGGTRAGSGGGNTQVANEISRIAVGSGQSLINYDFCEIPAGTLSGYVFQDGAPIELQHDEALPERIGELRDGRRTNDDTPLPGVVLELRDGITGRPIVAQEALPGTYRDGPIETSTDAAGFYYFVGLRPGTYAVYQRQPGEYIDGVDTPGSTSGFVFNPGEPVNEAVLQALEVDPQNNAIVRISLPPAKTSVENNFSEVIVHRLPPPPSEPPRVPRPPTLPPLPPGRALELGPRLIGPERLPQLRQYVVRPTISGLNSTVANTWHLSVVDAGRPRGSGLTVNDTPPIWLASAAKETTGSTLSRGIWQLHGNRYGHQNIDDQDVKLGLPFGIPVTGDFNGDGFDEVAIYHRGEWYIDVNANGTWDGDDLWARLGDRDDLPVSGDWDGDGKDDIGVYGRAWPGDPRAITHEPGLPDQDNPPALRPKNVPPRKRDATNGRRLMQLSKRGNMRADLIDHVFHYGLPTDIPVTGDWNGDGITSIGVFRQGKWYLDVDGDGQWTDNDVIEHFGEEGDRAVVGDFTGDGITDLGVFRAGTFILDTNGTRSIDSQDAVIRLGRENDVPVSGDWDGDGRDEVGVYRPQPDSPAEEVIGSRIVRKAS